MNDRTIDRILIIAFVVLCMAGILHDAKTFFFGYGVASFMRFVFHITGLERKPA